MIKKTFIIGALLLFLSTGHALQEIIPPDTSASRSKIIEKQKELLGEIKEKKGTISDVELGSLYGRLGMFYQSHEFFVTAKTCYGNAIELSKFDFRWHHLKGFVEYSLGNFDVAVKDYNNTLEINPEYTASKARWAELELERGEFDKAAKLYKEILKQLPDFARAYVGLGTIKMQQGEPLVAIEHYNAALKIQPNASQVNFLLSQAYASVGNSKKAEQYLASKGNREVVMYDKVMQDMHMHSLSPSYYAQASIYAFMNLDYELAGKLVDYSMTLDPDDVNIKLIKLNVIITSEGKEAAMEYVKALAKVYPEDNRVAYSMAMVYEMAGDDKNAIKWYKKELSLTSKNKTSTILVAKALMREKKYEKALVELKKANKMEGDFIYSLYAEAILLSYFKKCDESIELFYDIIAKKPKSFTYLTGFVKTVAVCNVKDESTKVNALNAARNMYQVSPSIKVTQALAMIESSMGNKKDAVDYQSQAIYQGIVMSLPKNIMKILKEDLELYKKGVPAVKAIKFYDIDINPERSHALFQK